MVSVWRQYSTDLYRLKQAQVLFNLKPDKIIQFYLHLR